MKGAIGLPNAAGASPEQFAEGLAGFESAWSESGRSEAPQDVPSSSDPQQVDLLADALGM